MLDYNKTERALNIFSCYHRWSSINPDVQLESYRWLEWWFFGSLKHLSDDPLRLMQVWLCTINNRIRWKGRKLNQLSHNTKFHYPCLWESWFPSCRCYPPFYFLWKSSLYFFMNQGCWPTSVWSKKFSKPIVWPIILEFMRQIIWTNKVSNLFEYF